MEGLVFELIAVVAVAAFVASHVASDHLKRKRRERSPRWPAIGVQVRK